ncbi:MAG: isochorismatase family protein, partial [Aquitalea sp.]|nr:isochorismatase family protein [Aquitalea sp.]
INTLIAKARTANIPIFAVRHTGPQNSPIAAGSPFWQLHPDLKLNATVDTLIDKTKPSCFSGTALAEQLRQAGIQQLFITGLKTQYCIDTNCRIAADMGLNPVLVSDAHSCMDTPILSAQVIIDHHNATLGGPFVRLLTTEDVVF